jgi:tetraacyldisaccharide 4'-kinase
LESIHQPLYFEDNLSRKKYKFEELMDKKLLSLSSLADPLSFEKSLTKLGLKVVRKVRFPDHYIYKKEDIEWLSEIVRKEKVDFIVTTEKDRVRLPKGLETLIPTLCLVMDFKIIKGEEILDNMINRILEEYKV